MSINIKKTRWSSLTNPSGYAIISYSEKTDKGMTMYLSPRKKLFVDTAAEMFGDGAVITKAEKTAAAEKAGVPFPTWFKGEGFSVGYNAYKLPSEGDNVAAPVTVTAAPAECRGDNGKSGCNEYGKTESHSRQVRRVRALGQLLPD
jgi:hypothetical protein